MIQFFACCRPPNCVDQTTDRRQTLRKELQWNGLTPASLELPLPRPVKLPEHSCAYSGNRPGTCRGRCAHYCSASEQNWQPKNEQKQNTIQKFLNHWKSFWCFKGKINNIHKYWCLNPWPGFSWGCLQLFFWRSFLELNICIYIVNYYKHKNMQFNLTVNVTKKTSWCFGETSGYLQMDCQGCLFAWNRILVFKVCQSAQGHWIPNIRCGIKQAVRERENHNYWQPMYIHLTTFGSLTCPGHLGHTATREASVWVIEKKGVFRTSSTILLQM